MESLLSTEQHAQLYDAENIWSADDEFFLAFANERSASRILDLGCGTGRLTLALAAAGHEVTGVDPHPGSLAAARSKAAAETVRWIEGTSAVLNDEAPFDAVLMTSHVAQAITDDTEWARTLLDIHRVLAPGGRLIFDSRDPRSRAWERWTPAQTRNELTLADGTHVQLWIDSAPSANGLVNITEHRLFADGSREFEDAVLAFRSEQQLRTHLSDAGLHVSSVFGGWHRQPAGHGSGELICIATR